MPSLQGAYARSSKLWALGLRVRRRSHRQSSDTGVGRSLLAPPPAASRAASPLSCACVLELGHGTFLECVHGGHRLHHVHIKDPRLLLCTSCAICPAPMQQLLWNRAPCSIALLLACPLQHPPSASVSWAARFVHCFVQQAGFCLHIGVMVVDVCDVGYLYHTFELDSSLLASIGQLCLHSGRDDLGFESRSIWTDVKEVWDIFKVSSKHHCSKKALQFRFLLDSSMYLGSSEA